MKKIVATVLSLIICFTCFGCNNSNNSGNSDNPANEEINKEQTQLYVYNYDGGYGNDWLYALKDRFEKANKDKVYEEGKKGVQIMIKKQKKSIDSISDSILVEPQEIYFTERSHYYKLLSKNVLGDITEAITTPLTEYGENESIADKMSAEQKEYYNAKKGDTRKYYGVPHYAGYAGLMYNIEFFEEDGLYFAKNPSGSNLADKFISKWNPEKSVGPDGKSGTSDDGLPTTYDEFFLLCDYIVELGEMPINWLGNYYDLYFNQLYLTLIADFEGIDNMMLNYTFSGEANDLGRIIDGNFVKDQAPTTITQSNGYELARQEGKYRAIQFLERIIKTDRYHGPNVFNGAYSHTEAQTDFLFGGNDGGVTPRIAMLMDGCWWEMEANDVFVRMEQQKGEKYSKYNRKFGFMPLPSATEEIAQAKMNGTRRNTIVDQQEAIMFMKANVADWKKPLAIEFIRFANTDESLREFTRITNTAKSLDYEITEEDKTKMTNFGCSIMELKNNSDIVYPYSSSSLFVNNSVYFDLDEMFRSIAEFDNKTHKYFARTFVDYKDKANSENYINGLYKYHKGAWETLVK